MATTTTLHRAAVQLVHVGALGVAVKLHVSPLLVVPLAALFGYRLRAVFAARECEVFLVAFRRQRMRVIELENKLASREL